MSNIRNGRPRGDYRPRRAAAAAGRMPTLVVGGAGFIGSHTVEALLARGHFVRVLDDLSSGTLDNLPMDDPRLEVRVGDMLEYGDCRSAMHGMSACVHLAAQVSVARSVEQPFDSALRNILGFINVIEAAREQSLQRLVYASSAAVYGNAASLPLQEDETPAPTSPYGLEKLVNEEYAALYRHLHGLRAVGLRFFNVYGPRQDPASPYSGVISRFLERLSSGRPPQVFGDGRQTRDFIHVGDVAAAIAAALACDYCGVCNVATGSQVDLLRLIEVLGASLGVAAQPAFGPAREGDIRHSCGAVARLHAELSFAPQRRLEDGLGELAAAAAAARRQAPRRPAPAPRRAMAAQTLRQRPAT